MSKQNSKTLDEDYSEAIVRIQHTHKLMQKEISNKDYVAARASARKIAVDAMLIGIWCRKFIDETAKEA